MLMVMVMMVMMLPKPFYTERWKRVVCSPSLPSSLCRILDRCSLTILLCLPLLSIAGAALSQLLASHGRRLGQPMHLVQGRSSS